MHTLTRAPAPTEIEKLPKRKVNIEKNKNDGGKIATDGEDEAKRAANKRARTDGGDDDEEEEEEVTKKLLLWNAIFRRQPMRPRKD